MASRLTIYDLDGARLAEITANVTRTWKLGEAAGASWVLSNNDAKSVLGWMQFGRYALVEHDKLPDWCGVIYPPRNWGYQEVQIEAKSGEYLLNKFRGPAEFLTEGEAGAVFADLFRESFVQGACPMQLGEVWSGGKHYRKPSNYGRVYAELRQIALDNQNDWDVTPSIASGRLVFNLNYYQKRGERRNLVLEENKNLEIGGRRLVEQGDIRNNILGYDSTEGTWQNRMTSEREDATSLEQYGYWADTITHTVGHIQSASDQVTQAALDKTKQPRRTIDLVVTHVTNEFQNLALGDQLRVILTSVGYTNGGFGLDTWIRILGMQYDDVSNKVKITCDEYTL
jgi:hypothetical protein